MQRDPSGALSALLRSASAFFPAALVFALAGCGPADLSTDVEADAELSGEVLDLAQSEQELCSGYAATCGAALAWLDGVPARSNGAYMGTGTSCAGAGTHGSRYQCVEFARRYWNLAKGHTFPGLGATGAASRICDLTPDRWIRHTPGDGWKPVRGDLFVLPRTSSYPYGHVAVVDTVVNGTVYVVEQNRSCSGRGSFPLSAARCILHPI